MGLLDAVVGALGQGGSGPATAGGGHAALLNAVIGMLAQGGGGPQGRSALGGLGGLAGLVGQLQQSGLGDIVASWISTGPNQPVSPGQLHAALGDETVSQLGQQTGLPHGELLGHLAQMLPQIIDRLTPQGQLPAHDDATADLSGLLGAFLNR